MARYILGIDPGATGALALIDTYMFEEQPPMLVALYKLTPANLTSALLVLMHRCEQENCEGKIVVETERGRPGDTPTTAFVLGQSFGQIQGQIEYSQTMNYVSGCSTEYVEPQAWQGSAFVGLSRSTYNREKELSWQAVRRAWCEHWYLLVDGYVGDIASLTEGNNAYTYGAPLPVYCLDAIVIALDAHNRLAKIAKKTVS